MDRYRCRAGITRQGAFRKFGQPQDSKGGEVVSIRRHEVRPSLKGTRAATKSASRSYDLAAKAAPAKRIAKSPPAKVVAKGTPSRAPATKAAPSKAPATKAAPSKAPATKAAPSKATAKSTPAATKATKAIPAKASPTRVTKTAARTPTGAAKARP